MAHKDLVNLLVSNANRLYVFLLLIVGVDAVFAALLLQLPCSYPCYWRIATLLLVIGSMVIGGARFQPKAALELITPFAATTSSSEAEVNAVQWLHQFIRKQLKALWRSLLCLGLAVMAATFEAAMTWLW